MIEINKIAEYIKYLEERNEGIQEITFTINKNGSGTFEDFFNGYIFVSFCSLEELQKKLQAQIESQSVNETAQLGIGAVSTSKGWELRSHSHQIADTSDYDGYYEITNGKISLLTKDDDDEALQPIVDALNDLGCKFYQDDWFEFENKMLKEEISRLKFMIDNGLGWEDISPMHEI